MSNNLIIQVKDGNRVLRKGIADVCAWVAQGTDIDPLRIKGLINDVLAQTARKGKIIFYVSRNKSLRYAGQARPRHDKWEIIIRDLDPMRRVIVLVHELAHLIDLTNNNWDYKIFRDVHKTEGFADAYSARFIGRELTDEELSYTGITKVSYSRNLAYAARKARERYQLELKRLGGIPAPRKFNIRPFDPSVK